MKKLILSMIFTTMFIACADNIVVATPEYTQTEQDSTYTQPIQETTDTTSYHFLFGSVCAALNVQSTGTLTGDSVVNVFVGTWHDKCVLVSEPASYIENHYYKSNQIITFLTENQSFDYNMVNSILTEVRNSGSIVYIYNSNSGLNFLYITPSW